MQSKDNQSLVDIPKVFFSDLTGAPIKSCISCECDLIGTNVPYLIEKALKPYNGYQSFSTVFEYAICMSCAEAMKGTISTLSMKRINQYFVENIDFEKRRRIILESESTDYQTRLNNCMVKGLDAKEVGELQIYAQCVGDRMVSGEFPYMVSGVALDEVVNLLSPKSIDDLDRFKNEVVEGPSEFQDLLQGGPKVFI